MKGLDRANAEDIEYGIQARWWSDVEEAMESDTEGHVCYVSLKGSRLLGINEAGADVDLRVIHMDKTANVLKLHPPAHTIEKSFFNSYGEEIDFVSYEMARFMHHLQNHNGNQIESLLVPEGFFWADEHGLAMREIGKRYVTKRLYNYYRGYARGQFQRAVQQIKTGKGITYTYREMYLGILTLATGKMIFNWPQLRAAVEGEFNFNSEVLNKVDMNRVHVDDSLIHRMQNEFRTLNAMLDTVHANSPLPETFDGTEVLNSRLLKWRSEGWV